MTLPPGYTRITDEAHLKSLAKATAATNPKLKSVLDQYESIVKNARVFAFKVGANGFADNVNILAFPAPEPDGEHIDDSYGQVKQTLESQLGATITGHRVATVAGAKALRVEYRLMIDKQRSVQGNQVYLIHQGKLLVVTITQNKTKKNPAEANRIIDSLRLL